MKGIIYELAYLISGQLDETQAQDLAKKIEKTLGESGVIVNSIEPKKIKLAYPIKKQQDGFLVSIDFTCESANIIRISKEIEKETGILRFLIIKKSAQKPEPAKEKPLITEIEEKKERVKKEKAESLEDKKEGLKKIEEDLDKILGQ